MQNTAGEAGAPAPDIPGRGNDVLFLGRAEMGQGEAPQDKSGARPEVDP